MATSKLIDYPYSHIKENSVLEGLLGRHALGMLGRTLLYAIFNVGQKIHVIKFSPTRAGSEIVENFLLTKIST